MEFGPFHIVNSSWGMDMDMGVRVRPESEERRGRMITVIYAFYLALAFSAFSTLMSGIFFSSDVRIVDDSLFSFICCFYIRLFSVLFFSLSTFFILSWWRSLLGSFGSEFLVSE